MRTNRKSLVYERGFSGVYGWISGTGTPPEPHFEILLLTKQAAKIGEVILGYVSGVFYRQNGDHKFVAIDAEWKKMGAEADLMLLDRSTFEEMKRIYSRVGENEGWYGAKVAQAHLKANGPTHV